MDYASEGFERIAAALMEMHQRTEVLIAENRHLQAELAALRRGEGIMVAIEGRLYPLVPGWGAANEPLYPPR